MEECDLGRLDVGGGSEVDLRVVDVSEKVLGILNMYHHLDGSQNLTTTLT